MTCHDTESGGHDVFKNVGKYKCAKKTNKTEIHFYEELYKAKSALIKHIPKYYGHEKNFIYLENIKSHFKHPVAIDIKLGKHTVDYSQLRKEQKMEVIPAVIKTIRLGIVDLFTTSNNLYYKFVTPNKICKQNASIIALSLIHI